MAGSQSAPSNADASAVAVRGLVYAWPGSTLPTLDIADFEVRRGERVLLSGPSGSGKSTLLSLLAGVLEPDRGEVSVLGTDLAGLNSADRDHFRADHIGLIFQLFNLVPYLSVLENVTLPCRFSHRRESQARGDGGVSAQAHRLLDHLGLEDADLKRRAVTELSVGQQQRVAAARALLGSPEIVIADEPTSSLDADRRHAFLDLLFRECAERQTTLIFVSHDASLAGPFDRVVSLREINALRGRS